MARTCCDRFHEKHEKLSDSRPFGRVSNLEASAVQTIRPMIVSQEWAVVLDFKLLQLK
jgi:hypothetical protein